MIVEVFKDESEGMVRLDHVDCRFYIIGWEQSHVYCTDKKYKEALERNKIFKKIPSSIAGVAIYFSPHNPYQTLAMINQGAKAM